MTRLPQYAKKFRTAIAAQDFTLAQRALEEFAVCFRSGSRTPTEIQDAQQMLEWGIQITKGQQAQWVEELMLLKRVFDAYGSPHCCHTWRVDG